MNEQTNFFDAIDQLDLWPIRWVQQPKAPVRRKTWKAPAIESNRIGTPELRAMWRSRCACVVCEVLRIPESA